MAEPLDAAGPDPAGNPPSISSVNFCGDWHYAPVGALPANRDTLQFYPARQHNTTWFYNQIRQGLADKNPLWTSGRRL